MEILNTPEADVAPKIEQWFQDHRDQLCDTLLSRLSTYDVAGLSKTAMEAMSEAVESYRARKHLSAVRTLLPEFECFARSFELNSMIRLTQSQAIKDLKETLNKTPLMRDEPLEMFSLMHFIDDHLFGTAGRWPTHSCSGRSRTDTRNSTVLRAMATCRARPP